MPEEIEEIVVTADPLPSFMVGFWDTFTFGLSSADLSNAGFGGGYGALNGIIDNLLLGPEGTFFYHLENGAIVKVNESGMSDIQIGALRKVLEEYDQNPILKDAMDYAADNGITIVLHYDENIHSFNGATAAWADTEYADDYGVISEDLGSNEQAKPGTEIHISINPAVASSLVDFSLTLVHELAHISLTSTTAITDVDLDNSGNLPVGPEADIYDDVFITGGSTENDEMDYFNAGIGRGGSGADTISGGSGYDDIQGHGGNDVLYGKGGADYIDGGTGTDVLFGGSGDDVLFSGTGSDTMYGGAGDDFYNVDGDFGGSIGDLSGNDMLYFADANNVAFVRDGYDLLVADLTAGSNYSIFRVWNFFNGKEIETVTLGNGTTFSASEIVAITSGGVGFPIVFDLDGDGIELVSIEDSNVKFDWDGDGKRDDSGWIGKDDGILVYDFNGNGKVDGAEELSFTQYVEGARTDFEGLASFDENGDGKLDAEDSIWADLFVWQDNGNGHSTHNELMTMEEAGIESIDLELAGGMQNVEGNFIFGTASYQNTDGTTGTVGDVGFRTDNALSEWAPYTEEHLAIRATIAENIDYFTA